MNERVNDPKFQAAAAILVDALADPNANKQDIWSDVWPTMEILAPTAMSDAQLLWHRLIIGLNNL